MVKYKCKICNKKFLAYKSARRKTCSPKCRLVYMDKIGYKKMSESDSTSWKGDMAGYDAMHLYIRKRYGKPTKCELDSTHKANYFHWANMTGKYTRNPKDYMQLCPKCHFRLDRRKHKRGNKQKFIKT